MAVYFTLTVYFQGPYILRLPYIILTQGYFGDTSIDDTSENGDVISKLQFLSSAYFTVAFQMLLSEPYEQRC